MTTKTTPRPHLITDEETGDIYRFTVIDGKFEAVLHAKRQPSEAEIQLKNRIDTDLHAAHITSLVKPTSYWLTAEELVLAKGFCLPESKIGRLLNVRPYEIYPFCDDWVYLYVRSEG